MIIPIDDMQRIRGAETCWQLERLKVAKSGKSGGDSRWVTVGHYTSLDRALSAAAEHEIRLDPAYGITECLEAAKRITRKYAELFRDPAEKGQMR